MRLRDLRVWLRRAGAASAPATARVIGIDLGTARLKAVELDHSDRIPRVTRLHLGPAPSAASTGGGWRQPGLRRGAGARIVGSVGGPDVLVQAIAVEEATSGDPLALVRRRSEADPAADAAPVSVDVSVPGADRAGITPPDAMVAAARHSVVEARRTLLREGGLDPDVIDVDGIAILNAFVHSHPAALDGSLVLLDVGASRTLLDVLDRGRLLLHRELAWGVGVGTLGTPSPAAPDPAELVEALERAASVVRARGLAEQLGRLWVCGGGATDLELVERLGEATRIETCRVDPFARVTLAPDAWGGGALDESGPLFVLALGLALRHS